MNTCRHECGYSTFSDWFAANVDDEQCIRLRTHGIESGVVGKLVYFSQTVPLYNEFANEIWELVLDDHLSIHDVIERQPFGNATSFANFMVWGAASRLAWQRDVVSDE